MPQVELAVPDGTILMLVALGDKPARRTRTVGTQIAPVEGAGTQVSTCAETSGTAVCRASLSAVSTQAGTICTACT
jgi:hypothetical protein